MAQQQKIVRRVEGLFAPTDQIEARFKKAQAWIDKFESRFTRARAQMNKLTPSLLAKAFRGELVAQDPTDEPTEKLLQRIKIQTNRTV